MSTNAYARPATAGGGVSSPAHAATSSDFAKDTLDEVLSRRFRGPNRDLAGVLLAIVTALDDYWPLTVRQVFYQAVAKLLLPNNRNAYNRVSRILTTLRREDALTWDAIEDRTGRTVDKRGVPDLRAFVQEQMETFLQWRYYHRCYVQRQAVYVEVATEKDALSSILEEAVWQFYTALTWSAVKCRRRWSRRWPAASTRPSCAGNAQCCSTSATLTIAAWPSRRRSPATCATGIAPMSSWCALH